VFGGLERLGPELALQLVHNLASRIPWANSHALLAERAVVTVAPPAGREARPRLTREQVLQPAYGLGQPPTLPDEHRDPSHRYVKVGIGVALGFTPRSTHANLQPLTH
jgi:hypothetical protein